MIKDEYSPYKIIHHPDKLQELKGGKPTVPIQVQLVPSNVCNQRCSFCTYRMEDYMSNFLFDEKLMMSYEKVLECLDDFVDMGVRAVHYTGGGEPLVHPKIYEIFTDTINRGLDLALVSNGMALNEKLCELLGDAKWTRISVDCATSETYSTMRTTSLNTFQKVLRSIELLVKYKKSCVVGVGFVVNKDNYSEIYSAAKMFKSIGVDNFRISAAFTVEGLKYFDDFVDIAKEAAKATEQLSTDSFKVFNLFGDRINNMFEDTQNYDFCPTKELLTFIGADYNVYTCCTIAYNNRGLIGSIKNHSFRELWESNEKINMFMKHNPRKMCRHHCMYKERNEFINYCIKQDPKHVNFP